MAEDSKLVVVKAVHTVIWAFFVGCIIGAPIAAAHGIFVVSFVLSGFVALEGIVLLLHGWTCPLTAVAGRYTSETRANFDIYLPLWLAKHNKAIFTPLYVLGVLYSALRWWQQA